MSVDFLQFDVETEYGEGGPLPYQEFPGGVPPYFLAIKHPPTPPPTQSCYSAVIAVHSKRSILSFFTCKPKNTGINSFAMVTNRLVANICESIYILHLYF